MRKFIYLLLFCFIAIGSFSCKKQSVDEPTPPTPPIPVEPTPFECILDSAERLSGEEYAENDYVLRFEAAESSLSLILYLVGTAEDKVLSEGEYKMNDGLILERSSLTIDAKQVDLVSGRVVVERTDEEYEFAIEFSDNEEQSYVLSYEGSVENMRREPPKPDSVEFTPLKVTASLYAKGHFMVKFYADDTLFHKLDMYDNSATASTKYLSAGEYSFENGGVGREWSSYGYYNEENEVAAQPFNDVRLTVSPVEDDEVAIVGSMEAAGGLILLVDWQGRVEGFNFDEEPVQKEDVVFEAERLEGTYYGNRYSEAGNYYIYLTDNGFTPNGGELPNSTYYRIDLYGALYEGEESEYVPLPVGTYKLDYDSTMSAGTFDIRYSGYWKTDANGGIVSDVAHFEMGEFIVTEQGATLTATIGGVKHSVSFVGEAQIVNGVMGDDADVTFNATEGYAVYYGDQYTPGQANNFYLYFSDRGVNDSYEEFAGATYYRFDLYADIAASKGGCCIPEGEYYLDTTKSYAAGTFSSDMSKFYVRDASGKHYAKEASLTAGYLNVSSTETYAELEIDGVKHKVLFDGRIDILNPKDDGGNDDGGDDGNDDGGNDDGDDDDKQELPTEDVMCNLEGCTLYYEYCGDMYGCNLMNWTMLIAKEDLSGEYILFDLLTDATNTTDFFGRYEVKSEMGEYVLQAGKLLEEDNSIYTQGSWYFNAIDEYMLPIDSGWLEIEAVGDKTVAVSFELKDDRGVNITGGWSGSMISITDVEQSGVRGCAARAQSSLRSLVY